MFHFLYSLGQCSYIKCKKLECQPDLTYYVIFLTANADRRAVSFTLAE